MSTNTALTRYASFMFLIALVLSGCVASQQDVRTLDLRLRTVNSRLDNVDRDLDDLRQQTTLRAEKNAVESLQKNLARSGASLDRLQAEIMKLKGNIEEVAHRATITREENQDYLNDLGQRMARVEEQAAGLDARIGEIEKGLAGLTSELNNRFAAVDEAIKGLGQETETIRARMRKAEEEAARKEAEAAARAARAAREAEERARRARTPKNISPRKTKQKSANQSRNEKTNKTAAKGVKVTKTVNSGADDPATTLYNEGQAAFKAGKYRDAYMKFSSYLEKYPKGRLAGNARFWLGDCLYQQKEFALAILEYQKVIDDYRNHPKKPAALLKQGLAFEKLADRKTAKIVYLKLLKLYPGKPESKLAQKRLNAIQ